jgi:Tfp pilus assembly protein PilN
MGALYAFQSDRVAAKLSSCKKMQDKLGKVEKVRDAIQSKADTLKAVLDERSVWQKRIDAVRNSLFEGIWLTDLTPIKDTDGKITGLRIVGRGWSDKLKVIEEKASAAGRRVTAVEELRDRLKAQSVFGKGPQDVKIVGVKDYQAYLVEFTIEATLETASSAKDETAR